MRLIVVRHGETIENREKICQGQTDGTLSELGIKQAKKLALRLRDEKFDRVYSSDLGRAVNTAKEIMRYHPDLKLKLDKRLRERHIAEIAGQKFSKDFDWNNLPKGSETRQDLYDRVKNFLDELYSKHKDKTVLIVTHGGVKIIFLLIAYNKPLSDFLSFRGIKNTSVSIWDMEEEGNYKVHLVNCTKHLN